MYLKEYKWDNVPDDKLFEIAKLVFKANYRAIYKKYGTAYIEDTLDGDCDIIVEINKAGRILLYITDISTNEKSNTPEIDHLLLETQWIDPNKTLPEEGQLVVVKSINDDGSMILTSKFIVERNQKESGYVDFYFVSENNSGEIICKLFVDDIIGWLPADNVVL